MSFRARTSAIAATAATFVLLLTPTAMASAHRPVQVTGKQLRSALIPPAGFLSGYHVAYAGNSGGSLEHGAINSIPPMNCSTFWGSIGVNDGYGETAFAEDLVASGSTPVPVVEIFHQAVYQFASSRGAASLYGQISAKYRSCRSVSVPDTQGGTLREMVHARFTQRVGGHQALLLVEHLSDSRIAGPPVVTYTLWTIYGTDIYLVDSQLLNVTTPRPTLSSLTLKLIARVGALR
jgi:hypothetical protein